MADDRRRPLTNDDWGVESNCFVCERRNQSGLRIPFFHDEDEHTVTAEFELDDRFSGAPRFVHGGLTLAILDEAMAWATIAVAGRFAVTTETTTRFERPVRVGRPHRVRAWITAADGTTISTAAEVRRTDDRVCATARAEFTALDLDQAAAAAGTPLTDETATYASGEGG